MKKIFSILIVLIIIIGAVWFYISRPITEPSESEIESSTPVNEDLVAYSIEPTESEAKFSIFEVLRGEDFTAVGNTNNISGNIFVDLDDMSKTEISDISVNARTLKTDNANRDGAIARLILKSEDDANEFITFTPKSIEGLPESEFSEAVEFTITGDLNVSGVVNEVTFNGTVADLSEEKLVISANTTVKRSDFDLVVPDFSFLASVDDEVDLALTVVARPNK